MNWNIGLIGSSYFLEGLFHAYVCDITHIKYKPLEMPLQISSPNAKFSNQARLGQIMFKPMKYLKTTRSGDLCGVSMLAWLKPSVWFWETHVFTSIFAIFSQWCQFCQFAVLSWTRKLVSKFNYFSGSFLANESPCYIAGCESRQQLQASDIF